ncbi:hypothetical protein AB0I55_05915 [Actinocatenispora sera]|uniref:trypsin-like serine peptidase n=1 Tax=Actinocatenispora sera TaxID=390989 RepID=UPI0033D04EF7
MRPSLRAPLIALSACSTILLAVAVSSPAVAAPSPAAAVSATAHASGTAATDRASVRNAVAKYWTPERMARAIPADGAKPHGSARDQPTPTGPRRSVAPATPTHQPAAAAAAHAGTGIQPATTINASPTVGKVFFHDPGDGLDYVCSGSAINGSAKNLVSTAGHCVYDADHSKWMTNWQFVPYYDHGDRPYGTWYAAQLTTFQGWTSDGDSDWDVGFVNVWRNDGTRLVDTVGGDGIEFNYPKDLYITILAYPAEDPFDGEWQYYCQNNIYPHGSEQIGFDCLLTGGSSGGPFFDRYNNSTYLGYVDGIVSHGPDDVSYSPYFDTDVMNLYNEVASYTT